jgi:Rps23 Pro-64 3,4-dihydroxylase Tpa1-like proline 4-hydroxylase
MWVKLGSGGGVDTRQVAAIYYSNYEWVAVVGGERLILTEEERKKIEQQKLRGR